MDELYDKAKQEAIDLAKGVCGKYTQTIAAEIKAELDGLFKRPEYKGSVDAAEVVDAAFECDWIAFTKGDPTVALADAVRARFNLGPSLS